MIMPRKLLFCYSVILTLIAALTQCLVASDSHPKNVILVIGDGMGYNQVLAGRIHRGDFRKPLCMETLPVSGNMSPFAIGDDFITDSAASATAMATGCSTENGRISTFPNGSDPVVLFEELKQKGHTVGVLTNGSLNGATPAAFMAHAANRDDKADISRQIFAFKPDYFIGCSDDLFHPDLPEPITEASVSASGWSVYIDQPLSAVNFDKIPVCVGYNPTILEEASMEEKKNVYAENAPTLLEGFKALIGPISSYPDGFFLLVEEDWIDTWGHENEFELVSNSVSDLDDVVRPILDFAKQDGETLVIVTADHECGGLTIPVLSEKGAEAHFSTDEHTAAAVPLFAYGPGSQRFAGTLTNTEIHEILLDLLELNE